MKRVVGLLIFGGRLADAFGRKLVFLVGIAMFTAASLTAGLSSGAPALLSSRIAQGVSAALLSPSALSVLTTEYTGRDRNRALCVWAAIGGFGAAVGVITGGALTSGPGWRWVFFINVPIGVLVVLGALAVVPRRPVAGGSRLDIPGTLVGISAVTVLIFAVIHAGDVGWTSVATLPPIAAALLLGLVFVLIERRVAAPLVPLPLLRRSHLSGGVVVMLWATGLLLSAFFLSSLYLQNIRHFSAMSTGLVFLLDTHGQILIKLLPGLVIAALGLGPTLVAVTTSGLTGIPERFAGVASGVINAGHELGGSLGIAVFSTLATPSLAAAGDAGAAAAPAAGGRGRGAGGVHALSRSPPLFTAGGPRRRRRAGPPAAEAVNHSHDQPPIPTGRTQENP